MSFGQHQDTELWNNQISRPSFSGVQVSWRMGGLVYNKASRDKVDVDAFHKDIQYALEKLGESNFVSLQVNLEFSAPYSFEILAHRPSPPGEGVLPYMGYIGTCRGSLRAQTHFRLSLDSAENSLFPRNQVTAGNTSAFVQLFLVFT